MKIYFKQSVVSWLYWYTNLGDKHLTLRFAGKPSFLLEQYIEKHWLEEWRARYKELLELLKNIGDNGKSPFVLYHNDLNS